MDKETLSNYGWIVVLVLILAVLLALATPFGNFIAGAFKATYAGFGMVGDNALGIVIPGSGGGEENGAQTPGLKFYQPYRYTMTENGDESIMEYVFHENGAVDTYMFYCGADGTVEKYGESIPEGTCTYDDEYVYVEGEPAFKIGPNGSYVEMDGEGTFTLVPTPIKYLQYGATYVNDWIVEEDYPHMIFAEDGSAKYYGDGGAEQNFPAGTFVYKERYIEFSGENCAVYPDGTKIALGDILLEIGCPHKNTELRNESETYTGDEYCKDCGKLLNKGKIICLHTNTELRNVSEEYTGDTYCKDCGELVKNGESLLITFTIAGYGTKTFSALPGMTWGEWINSKYNTDGYGIVGNYWEGVFDNYYDEDGLVPIHELIHPAGDYMDCVNVYNGVTNDMDVYKYVTINDTIIEGHIYRIWPLK